MSTIIQSLFEATCTLKGAGLWTAASLLGFWVYMKVGWSVLERQGEHIRKKGEPSCLLALLLLALLLVTGVPAFMSLLGLACVIGQR